MQYRHYKGGIYEWVCEAKLEADPAVTLVIYRSRDGAVWARPREAFFGKVEHEGETLDRFKQIS